LKEPIGKVHFLPSHLSSQGPPLRTRAPNNAVP
jgi:hypothetical protein